MWYGLGQLQIDNFDCEHGFGSVHNLHLLNSGGWDGYKTANILHSKETDENNVFLASNTVMRILVKMMVNVSQED